MSKMATTIGDKSYCPIVSLLTRYADFSSCYFTPSIRTHSSYSNQEYVFETIIEYLAIRLAHVLFPARQRNQTNTLTAAAETTTDKTQVEEEEEEDKRLSISNQSSENLVVFQAPIYMFIDMNMLGDETTIKRRKVKKLNSNTFYENYQLIQNKQFMHMNLEEQEEEEEDKEENLQQNCTILDNASSNNMNTKHIIELQSAGQSMRKVRFNLEPEVHVMCTWKFAYQAARKGDWHFYAVDRSRFQLRCQRASLYLNPILTPEHRNKIYMSRFAVEE